MSRFRLFGRGRSEHQNQPTPDYGSPNWMWPPVGDRAPAAVFPGPGEPWPDERPTDPHGFPPVSASDVRALPTPDPSEAAALAAAFALDYLSWDEDDPDRRGRVLAEYLPEPGPDPARLGWSGRGRQRAELAIPGVVRPDGEGRVLVDVRVRVTPYLAVGPHGPVHVETTEEIAGVPAVAPAPTARGWRGLPSMWIRLSVPVAVDGDRLVIDAWDEALGSTPHIPEPSPAVDEHLLQDDDPLADPPDHARSGW